MLPGEGEECYRLKVRKEGYREIGEGEECCPQERDEILDVVAGVDFGLTHHPVVRAELKELVDFGVDLLVDLVLSLTASVLEHGRPLKLRHVHRVLLSSVGDTQNVRY